MFGIKQLLDAGSQGSFSAGVRVNGDKGTEKGLENRGYRATTGKRVMTKEEWQVFDRERRIESNYSRPPINQKNDETIKSNPKYYTVEGDINWPPERGVLGETESMILNPGIIIDRFGYEGGTFD